jgi:FkbM family methyltransferase
MRGTRFRADPYHIAFWNEVNRGAWETSTLDALEEFLNRSSVFADIGAWIGPLTLFAAGRARRVFSFEPDPFAYECLLRNLRLNDLRNVTPFHLALGARNGLRPMALPDGQLGTSRTTPLVSGEGTDRIEACGIRWQDWMTVTGVDHLDFIKIDIEGGEFELLPSMRDYLQSDKPTVHLSLHAPFLAPEERSEKLQEIAEVLRVYRTWYDEERRPVRERELLEASRDGFTTYLFIA